MSMRSKGISTVIALAVTGAMCGIGAHTANAAPVEDEGGATVARAATEAQIRAAGADEICAVLGIGSGAAGLPKALAKGASWVGIGASVGCYAYTKAKNATPAQKRAAMMKSYNDYQAKSDLGKLEALGYSCRKEGGGGGGGTDFASFVGYRDIKIEGRKYKCGNIRD